MQRRLTSLASPGIFAASWYSPCAENLKRAAESTSKERLFVRIRGHQLAAALGDENLLLGLDAFMTSGSADLAFERYRHTHRRSYEKVSETYVCGYRPLNR